ncbi:MAG: hypothetical protein ACJ71E_06890 [Nitrososphaeraceae archaeon]
MSCLNALAITKSDKNFSPDIASGNIPLSFRVTSRNGSELSNSKRVFYIKIKHAGKFVMTQYHHFFCGISTIIRKANNYSINHS